jgi:hypothetical protein
MFEKESSAVLFAGAVLAKPAFRLAFLLLVREMRKGQARRQTHKTRNFNSEGRREKIMQNIIIKKIFGKVILFLAMVCLAMPCSGETMKDTDSIGRASQTIRDTQGEVTVTLDWLRRPGEFALTIDYYGYLTQEGIVNAYLSVNGTQREFITMKEELSNRHQRIRILSFHPTAKVKGNANRLATIADSEVIDYLLFKNAPYYPQFGTVKIELKFFAHGRWDGDGNCNNENYCFKFVNPLKDTVALDHF